MSPKVIKRPCTGQHRAAPVQRRPAAADPVRGYRPNARFPLIFLANIHSSGICIAWEALQRMHEQC